MVFGGNEPVILISQRLPFHKHFADQSQKQTFTRPALCIRLVGNSICLRNGSSALCPPEHHTYRSSHRLLFYRGGSFITVKQRGVEGARSHEPRGMSRQRRPMLPIAAAWTIGLR